jgi:hypothetical protein
VVSNTSGQRVAMSDASCARAQARYLRKLLGQESRVSNKRFGGIAKSVMLGLIIQFIMRLISARHRR